MRERLAIAYFIASTAVLVAPIYTVWGNRIEPRVFGLPWSLAYVLGVIAANFAVLVWMYRKGVGR